MRFYISLEGMTEAVENEESEMTFIKLRVQNPRYENPGYVSYEIQIETNNPCFNDPKSTLRRRYSEFVVLRKLLSKQFPAIKAPPLPSRSIFKDRFHPDFLKERSEALEEFLIKLVSTRMYLSSKALHLFLQSYYSIYEIKDIIGGKLLNSEMYYPEFSKERTPEPSTSDLSSHENGVAHNYMYQNNSVEENVESKFVNDNELSNCSNEPSIVKKGVKSSRVPYISNNSPAGSKRVSFCDEVTVAQIHIEET